jgi:galactokinase
VPSPRLRAEFRFEGRFGNKPKGVVFAPGRLNLIGEHIDHQGAAVLPIALRQGVACAWGPRPDRAVRIVALDANEGDRFTLGDYVRSGRRWADLARGVCEAMESRDRRLPGVDLVIAGDLPARRGLGSSAAFLVSILRAFDAAAGATTDPAEAVAVVMDAEARWGGIRCGAMDPYVAVAGKPGVPLLLDCKTLTHEVLPWPQGVEAVPHDTGIRRDLAKTPYNERRAELEEGLRRLAHARAAAATGATASTVPDDARLLDRVPEPFARRARHFVGEVRRVAQAAQALRRGDAEGLGRLLDEGHRSLSHDFECSTPDIDAAAAALREQPGVLGVRLQGAGFGGCFVVLRRVRAEGVEPSIHLAAETGS